MGRSAAAAPVASATTASARTHPGARDRPVTAPTIPGPRAAVQIAEGQQEGGSRTDPGAGEPRAWRGPGGLRHPRPRARKQLDPAFGRPARETLAEFHADVDDGTDEEAGHQSDHPARSPHGALPSPGRDCKESATAEVCVIHGDGLLGPIENARLSRT